MAQCRRVTTLTVPHPHTFLNMAVKNTFLLSLSLSLPLLIQFMQSYSNLRTFGFDIITEDEKLVYQLATETQKETEEWLLIWTE